MEPERRWVAWVRSRMNRESLVIEMVISLGKNWERVKETKPSMQTGSSGLVSRLSLA